LALRGLKPGLLRIAVRIDFDIRFASFFFCTLFTRKVVSSR
jgi:hypothetical protein